ncbi:MAG: phosphotransferase family protein [Rubrobacteraceae bacterium]
MDERFSEELAAQLASLFGGTVEVERPRLIPGGASKDSWAVDLTTRDARLELLVRRGAGGVIYSDTLSLKQEFQVVEAAYRSGVRAPKPYGYLEDLAGREAFIMERLEGESLGRRLVQRREFAAAREVLPRQMAEELSRIHAIPAGQLPDLPGAPVKTGTEYALSMLESELDALGEPHPAIELGLLWLRENWPPNYGVVLNHGDFRLGNFMVNGEGLVGVLDWEFAHYGDPVEDLAWPLVKAWRFGMDHLRLGGFGEVEPFLDRYNELTDLAVTTEDLFFWEIAGNVRWAIGALNQARRHLSGQERSVELAVLGRLAAEVEYEILYLIEKGS